MTKSCCAPALTTPKKTVVMSGPAAGLSKDSARRKIKKRGETIVLLVNDVNGEA